MPELVECRFRASCLACQEDTSLRDPRVHVHLCSDACAEAVREEVEIAARTPDQFGPNTPPKGDSF